MLPVELPEVPDYSPRTFDPDDAASEPEPPLGRVSEWVEVELDQCWDLLRQRRALREAGRDPDAADARRPEVVENYEQ